MQAHHVPICSFLRVTQGL